MAAVLAVFIILIGVALIDNPSLLAVLSIALFLAAIFFAAGLRPVPTGDRAIVVTLGSRNPRGDEEFAEGWYWIFPLISHFKKFSALEQSDDIKDFDVETGCGLVVWVTVAFQWSFVEGRLYDVSKLASPSTAIKNHLRSAIRRYLAYVTQPEDVHSGEVSSGLDRFLIQSLRWRCEGYEWSIAGSTCRDLQPIQGERTGERWGIKIHSLDVISVNNAPDVRRARHVARVDEIAAEIAPKVGEGMAGFMGPVLEAGGSAELAQQQAQQHQKPRAEVIEPQPRTVIIPSSSLDSDLGAAFTARALADQSSVHRTEKRRRRKTEDDRGEDADS